MTIVLIHTPVRALNIVPTGGDLRGRTLIGGNES